MPLGTVQLPQLGRANALMVPLAIADRDNEPAIIHVSAIDGCSSLKVQRLPGQLIRGGWNLSLSTQLANGCGTALETRRVPTVTLAVVLRDWLGGQPVEFMHIDVQGAELDVLRSGGRHLARQVRSLMVEVPAPGCATLTKGAPNCSEVFAAIEELDFVADDAFMWNGAPQNLKRGFGCDAVPWSRWNSRCEFDILFVQRTTHVMPPRRAGLRARHARRRLAQHEKQPAAVSNGPRRCAIELPALGTSYACPPPLVDTSTTAEFSASTPWGRSNQCADTSPPPLVAHCVAGLARTFSHPWVYRNFRHNLVNGFGGRAALLLLLKIFGSDTAKPWERAAGNDDTAQSKRRMLQAAIEYVAPQMVRLLRDDATAEAAVNHDCNISWHGAPIGGVAPDLGSRTVAQRLFYSTAAGRRRLAGQLTASAECLHMVEEYELAHGIRFNYVTRSRPDLAYLSPMLPYCFFADPKVLYIDKKDFFLAMRREVASTLLAAPLEHYRMCRGTAWWVEHEQLLRASAIASGYRYKVFPLPACRAWDEHRPNTAPRQMPGGGEFSCQGDSRLGLHLQASNDLKLDSRTGAFVCQGSCQKGTRPTGYNVYNCSQALRAACATGRWDSLTDESCAIPGYPMHHPCPTEPACERDPWHLPSEISTQSLVFNARPPEPGTLAHEGSEGSWAKRYHFWLKVAERHGGG